MKKEIRVTEKYSAKRYVIFYKILVFVSYFFNLK